LKRGLVRGQPFIASRQILIDVLADTKLSEMLLPEDRVLEKLNAVSTAKRLANMVRIVSLRINLPRPIPW